MLNEKQVKTCLPAACDVSAACVHCPAWLSCFTASHLSHLRNWMSEERSKHYGRCHLMQRRVRRLQSQDGDAWEMETLPISAAWRGKRHNEGNAGRVFGTCQTLCCGTWSCVMSACGSDLVPLRLDDMDFIFTSSCRSYWEHLGRGHLWQCFWYWR